MQYDNHVMMARFRIRSWLGMGVILLAASAIASAGRGPRAVSTPTREELQSRALFEKNWHPTETGQPGGDGLGPLFNDTSCAACHHQGGPGGGGTNRHNVNLLSVVAGIETAETGSKVFKGELEEFHPGLRNGTSVVIHQHATTAADEKRLDGLKSYESIQTRDELFAVLMSQRSTPALFGGGLIDSLSDEVLLVAEARKYPGFPEISGRVSHVKGGRLGRFGWKGQTSSLRDFVLAACSNELGLEVPGRHQVSLAATKDFDPSKLQLDMDKNEARMLVSFVAELPRPVARGNDTISVTRGRFVFEAIGCAACHTPKLGPIDGLYSDLLLHDMGDRMQDFGSGYGAPANPAGFVDLAKGIDAAQPSGDATATEWRTPPLWGVASSWPYLHDGRASTLDDAIRLHGGEAAATSSRYAMLALSDRRAVLSLLRSLVSPPQALRSVETGKLTRN